MREERKCGERHTEVGRIHKERQGRERICILRKAVKENNGNRICR